MRERSRRALIIAPVTLLALGTLTTAQALLDPLFPASFVGQATSNALAICTILPWLMFFVRSERPVGAHNATGHVSQTSGRVVRVLLFSSILILVTLAIAKIGAEEPRLRTNNPNTSSWSVIIPAFLGQAATEELIFRVLLPVALSLLFTTKKDSFFWGTLLANLAFAWWHIPASLPVFIDHFAFGLLMAFLYAKTKSFIILVVVHSSNNFFILLVDAPLVAGSETVTLLVILKYILLFWIADALFAGRPPFDAAGEPKSSAKHVGRQPSLDALRGFALIMIVLENSLFYAVPEWMTASPPQDDQFARGFLALLIEYRGLPIFCILLGFTAHLMQSRDIDGQQRLNNRARMFLVLGTIHGVFIFPGDILAIFGVALLALLWLNRRSAATRRITMWVTGLGFVVQAAVAGWGSTQTTNFGEISAGMLSFPHASLSRALEWLAYVLTVPFHISAVLFPILIGFTTWKGINQSSIASWRITSGAVGILIVSILLCLPNAILLSSSWGHSRSGFFIFIAQLGGMIGALGAWVLAVRVSGSLHSRKTPFFGALMGIVTTLGRRTLSLYLGSSVAFFVVLSPAGMNLFAYVSLWTVWALTLLGLLIYALNVHRGSSRVGWAEQAQQQFFRPPRRAPREATRNQISGDSKGTWISVD